MRPNAHLGVEKTVYTVERLLGPWLRGRASSARRYRGRVSGLALKEDLGLRALELAQGQRGSGSPNEVDRVH
jgi:hypothetical protein